MKTTHAAAAVVMTLLLAAACGGESPSTKAPSGPGASASAASTAAPTSNVAKAEDAPVADQAAMHEQFMGSCTKQLPAPDYCECSWGEFRKLFGANEDVDPSKMKEFQDRVRLSCGAKIPEDTVKASFATSCEGRAAKELKGYCTCAWTELRKRISVAEFTGTLDDDRGRAAKNEMIKSCGKQFPEGVAKKEFDAGCATSNEQKPFCECAWKVIRATASAAEIAANMVDMGAVKPKLQTQCGKLRKPDPTSATPVTPATKEIAPKK